ncbi:hypothetical protein GDO86_012674 [Hymenochirus boettgeri]|uniref:Uncharacterized protein n=1 Tax=Hymenochirus boettgeri TaxID=247094 RepID=A0A8T2IS13_9PIPI|nr:hypothetical protein GDO86_012674 [Hymenochirus boettgeri]KAG8434387.1 hypothetical protein GDO86_012674 [Hymenochirus boettgeri]
MPIDTLHVKERKRRRMCKMRDLFLPVRLRRVGHLHQHPHQGPRCSLQSPLHLHHRQHRLDQLAQKMRRMISMHKDIKRIKRRILLLKK